MIASPPGNSLWSRGCIAIAIAMAVSACSDSSAGIATVAATAGDATHAQAADDTNAPSGKPVAEKGPTQTDPSASASKSREILPQIVIAPGLERLSYLPPKLVGIRPDYRQCLSEQRHGEDCAEEEWQFQDRRMNSAYRSLLSKSTPAKNGRRPEHVAKAAVVASQRAWLAFMNSNCAAKAPRFGSSNGPATQRACEMQMTAYRAQELEDWSFTLERQSAFER